MTHALPFLVSEGQSFQYLSCTLLLSLPCPEEPTTVCMALYKQPLLFSEMGETGFLTVPVGELPLQPLWPLSLQSKFKTICIHTHTHLKTA